MNACRFFLLALFLLAACDAPSPAPRDFDPHGPGCSYDDPPDWNEGVDHTPSDCLKMAILELDAMVDTCDSNPAGCYGTFQHTADIRGACLKQAVQGEPLEEPKPLVDDLEPVGFLSPQEMAIEAVSDGPGSLLSLTGCLLQDQHAVTLAYSDVLYFGSEDAQQVTLCADTLAHEDVVRFCLRPYLLEKLGGEVVP